MKLKKMISILIILLFLISVVLGTAFIVRDYYIKSFNTPIILRLLLSISIANLIMSDLFCIVVSIKLIYGVARWGANNENEKK